MDDAMARAMARWPNVPDVYGWLSLDRRGRWRIRGETITHATTIATIGRNYEPDARGAWYFQNGPQRVFVTLDGAPWVLRTTPDGDFLTHVGGTVAPPHAAHLDETGALFVAWRAGIGCVDDRDLPALLDRLVLADGSPAGDAALERLLRGEPVPVSLATGAQRVPLSPIGRAELPERYGFIAAPAPES